jgi:transaldolase
MAPEYRSFMSGDTYLSWLIRNTQTSWWHDSAEAVELQRGLDRGCVGVTTNPFLSNVAVAKNRALWADEISAVLAQKLQPEAKAEALMRIAVTRTAAKLMPEYESSHGERGLVCAQVNPVRAGDRECMHLLAKRFHQWSPNIAVKLPGTYAGLDVLEECIAEGITCTATVSFTVPQAIAIAERHRRGIERAKKNGVVPGKCFAVIMIGRLDDFLREVAHDNKAPVSESDIQQAGLAVTKRSYAIYRERGYQAVLLVAALRGSYHLTEIAGADLIMSISPAFQEIFVNKEFPREERIEQCVPADIIDRLRTMPEFVRAYEPDGMAEEEFVSFGATQRTLSQFCEVGWKLLEAFQ